VRVIVRCVSERQLRRNTLYVGRAVRCDKLQVLTSQSQHKVALLAFLKIYAMPRDLFEFF
jgi:hypothetical protein